jgi:competence protein ComEC
MLYLKIWDVKRGNAVYIRTPNGKNIVQDLGVGSFRSGSSSFSPLLFIKDKMKVDRLDEVIITHPHADHILDIDNFDALNAQALFRPDHLTEAEVVAANRGEDGDVVNKYIEINKNCSGPLSTHDSPLREINNGGASIETFLSIDCGRSNINNHSVVTVISYAASKVVIPGDNESESWENLLRQNTFRQAIKGTDILVAAHHGTESGYCAALLEHIRPKLVVISNGRFADEGCMTRYGSVASGLGVHRRSGGRKEEKCLATMHDGSIEIAMGWIKEGHKSYLSVTAE